MRAFLLSFIATAFVLYGARAVRADEPVRLKEQFPAGYQYHVSTRVDLSGTMSLPAEKGKPAPKPLPVKGESAIEYDERILAARADGEVLKTARIYRRMDFQRKVGDQPQQSALRPAVRRLVVLRQKNVEVPFSPDGPLMWSEIDLVRTDVFTPALTGLLPTNAVRPGERWTATELAVQELTDLEKIEEGRVECRLEQITLIDKRRHARIAFAGTVRGVNEDGPNRQQLDGYLFFDLESNHISYLSLKGVSSLLDKDGKELGRVEGQFVLTRQANQRAKDMSDDAWRGVAVEPNEENTLLLYDNEDLGIRCLHPRAWRVAAVHNGQVDLDHGAGHGLRLTLEPPARAPTGAQFLIESRAFLQQQKATIVLIDPPRRIQGSPHELEQFAIEADVAGQRVLMDYYAARQARGGATMAARLLTTDQAAVKKEVERIARSVVITRTASGKEN